MMVYKKKKNDLKVSRLKPDYVMQIALTINAFLVCLALVTKFIDPWFFIFPYWLITGVRNMFNLKAS